MRHTQHEVKKPKVPERIEKHKENNSQQEESEKSKNHQYAHIVSWASTGNLSSTTFVDNCKAFT
ncbi:hypothetical protein ACTXT7_004427 [Hymenolepis weldensis]